MTARDRLIRQAKRWGARTLHRALLLRARAEALLDRRLGRTGPRVLATACWSFPIYSQTFVYQELDQLIRRGFTLAFSYSRLEDRRELPPHFGALWHRRRRLLLHETTARDDFEHYQRRMPERVREVVRTIAEAAGLTEAEVERHEHVLHAFSFTRIAEAWGAEYLHSYFFYERTLFAFVASQLLGIPRGVSCYADHLLDDYPLKLVPLHVRTCDVVVATSSRIARELQDACGGVPLPQIVVKPNAIDSERFTAPRPPRPPDAPLRLVCVSRIDPKKGLVPLAEAVAMLREAGVPVVARVLGAPDAHSAASLAYDVELRERVRALGLEPAFSLEGSRPGDEVRAALVESDVFVAPFVELPNGDKDGIPTALLEAMASGCPVVATDAGSIGEVIDHEVTGLLVPQRDPRALAAAIGRLAADAALRDRLGRAAADHVRRHFDVRECEERFHARVRAVTGRLPGATTVGVGAA